jgi:hypothetical protein
MGENSWRSLSPSFPGTPLDIDVQRPNTLLAAGATHRPPDEVQGCRSGFSAGRRVVVHDSRRGLARSTAARASGAPTAAAGARVAVGGRAGAVSRSLGRIADDHEGPANGMVVHDTPPDLRPCLGAGAFPAELHAHSIGGHDAVHHRDRTRHRPGP